MLHHQHQQCIMYSLFYGMLKYEKRDPPRGVVLHQWATAAPPLHHRCAAAAAVLRLQIIINITHCCFEGFAHTEHEEAAQR